MCRYVGFCLAIAAIAGCSFRSDSPDRWIRVQFSAPGLSALEAERELAQLAEESLRGIRDIRTWESVSRPGEVVVWLRLDKSAHLLNVRSLLAEQLQATSWPEEMREPELSSASNGPFLLVALHSEAGDISALRSTAERFVRRLQAVPGVSNVLRFPPAAQVEVCIDHDRLRSHDLTVEDVAQILQQQNSSLPDAELVVRSRDASTIEDLVDTPLVVRENGSAIRLADVAEVRLGWGHVPELRGANWPSGWILIGAQVESPKQSAACSVAMDEALQGGLVPPELNCIRGLGAEHEVMLATSIRFWESLLPPGITLRQAESPRGYSELTPVPADLCCRITGPDIDELLRMSAEFAKQLGSHQEVAETRVYGDEQHSEIKIEVDADLAARFGIQQDSVMRAVRLALGRRVTRVRVDDVPTDVVIRGAPEQGWPAEWLKNISVRTPSGEQVPIVQVCRRLMVAEPREIWRYESARCIRVQATARGDRAIMRRALEQPLIHIQDRLSTSGSNYQLHIDD